jgi:hypothetical protein
LVRSEEQDDEGMAILSAAMLVDMEQGYLRVIVYFEISGIMGSWSQSSRNTQYGVGGGGGKQLKSYSEDYEGYLPTKGCARNLWLLASRSFRFATSAFSNSAVLSQSVCSRKRHAAQLNSLNAQ